MIVDNTSQKQCRAASRVVAGIVAGLACAPSWAQSVESPPSAGAFESSIRQDSAEATDVPLAPRPDPVPAESPEEYEPPSPDAPDDGPSEPVPLPTVTAPVAPAFVPPLPSPPSVMPVAPHAGHAFVTYPCPPAPRHQCCLEGKLDRRCIYGIPPHGMAVRATFGAQIARADASQMMLYEYDFVPGDIALTPRGRHQLTKIAAWATQTPFPIVVQALPGSPALAEARRARVVEQLQANGWTGFEERVVVGKPLSPGLHGLDALPIAERLPFLSAGGTAGPGGPSPTAAPIPAGP